MEGRSFKQAAESSKVTLRWVELGRFGTGWKHVLRLRVLLSSSRLLALLVVYILSVTCVSAQNEQKSRAGLSPELQRGRDLALQYCSSCHLFPEPELLTKTAWVHHIQPDMAKWLGIEQVDYEGMQDGNVILEAGLYPNSPILPETDWFAIWDYYRAAAPSQPTAQPAKASVRVGLKQFRVKKLNPHNGVPMTSLVKIDAERKRLFVGDAIGNTLFTLDPDGGVTERLRLPSGPIKVAASESGMLLTLIGRFFPSEAQEGAVLLLAGGPSKTELRPLIESLRRPTDTVVAHLNTDRREDLVVCSYGNRLGRFSWFEGKEDGGYEEHVLLDRPGAIHADVRDFNGDGRPDIIVMMAQAREGIYLFLNQGRNEFKMETLLEFPPTWGLAGFELADFNKDGKIDLIVANGDNGDFALPLKSYHGIRIYLNGGKNDFREAFFHPMHGAYKAMARDFDGDGDLDLAAIAFYPDFTQTAPESFVYLQNQGGMKFDGYTFAESNAGRWMVMDAGDIDGDGDEDLALGSFVRGPTTMPVPIALREQWRTNGAVVMLLENVGKNPGR